MEERERGSFHKAKMETVAEAVLCSEKEYGTRAEDGISVYRLFHKSWFESDSSVHNSLGSSSSLKRYDIVYI